MAMRRVQVMKKGWRNMAEPDQTGMIRSVKRSVLVNSYEASFHAWGLDSEEVGDSIASDSVAIVEKDDGSIALVYPPFIKFLEGTDGM